MASKARTRPEAPDEAVGVSLEAAIKEDSYIKLSARDGILSNTLPKEFLDRFEVHSYRNASNILASANAKELSELVESLMEFRITMNEIITPGGNKSIIAKNMDTLLVPKGWYESRITGDLIVKKTTNLPDATKRKKGEKKVPDEKLYKVENYIDGHKIDFVKNRVAFDMEWNSKDQTFDRDLYAVRTFYECGIVDAGVLLTRSASLGKVFAEIGSRGDIKDFKSKYGASTTWMGKLLYRLDAGRGGGCPVLAIGITPAVIEDFEDWKSAHPEIKREMAADELIKESGEEEDE
ncbi:BglII/BstYI family type II restriction endonuclease [Acidisoma silvae]|uniref:Restriction endonuclease n=1 Tax=Acidisoma silvae TaxID=2802396 RepID=A0A964E226_9PROT|nr:BglII/BstYI family type II restriction endonuclease [Acidisoma silvae]MCB8878388.1 hypothetical protein [Acidisoma silvae]